MASAFQSLKSGIEADIKLMAENNFIDVDEAIIHEIYICMKIIKIGKTSISPTNWVEAWRLYGFHNYSKINAFLEKQLHPKLRTALNIERAKPSDEKIIALQGFIAPAPALLKKIEKTIQPSFDNEYAGQSFA